MIKKTLFKPQGLSAAILSVAVSAGAFAFEPQDYGTSTLIGSNDFNLHNAWLYNNVVCGALCVAFSTETGAAQEVYRVPDSLAGASETLTCDVFDASGSLLAGTEGNTPQIVLSYVYNDDFGGIPGNDVSFDNVNGPGAPTFGAAIDMVECALETDALGKISGGWMMTFSELTPGYFIHSFRDFETRKMTVVQCPAIAGSLTIAEVRSIDGPAIQNGDFTTLPAGCTSIDSLFDMNYLTCDTRQACGSGGKAVPVPGFAALLLGLSVVWIARSTAARRHER